MGRAAKVTSIDSVRIFAASMQCFQDDAATALENLASEIQRAIEWVQSDQKGYWELQVRRGHERVGEAKANLQRSLVAKRVSDHEPSCIEERKALEKAKRRLRLAEEKIEAVRHWSYTVERAVVEYQGCIGQLSTWLDSDCPRALASLDRMSRSLESYAALQSKADDTMASAVSTASRPEDAPSPQNSPPQSDTLPPDPSPSDPLEPSKPSAETPLPCDADDETADKEHEA